MKNLEMIKELAKDDKKLAYFLTQQFCPHDGESCLESGFPDQDCYKCIREYLNSDWGLTQYYNDKIFEEIKEDLE